MHLKVFVKLEKNPKNPLVWAKKNKKNPKKPTGLGFFKKTRVFSNPAVGRDNVSKRLEIRRGAWWTVTLPNQGKVHWTLDRDM